MRIKTPWFLRSKKRLADELEKAETKAAYYEADAAIANFHVGRLTSELVASHEKRGQLEFEVRKLKRARDDAAGRARATSVRPSDFTRFGDNY